jgi:creatinine amidohydrolase
MERRWEYLHGDEFWALMEKEPIAWVPVGILEHHNGHLPWGLDGLKAHGVCHHLAERLGGVVLPDHQLAGVHGDGWVTDPERKQHCGQRGLFLYTEATFRRLLLETFDSLANLGFKVIVGYSGHYPKIQIKILQEAAEEFTARGGATVLPFVEPMAFDGEGDHGGKYETSIFRALADDNVRMDHIQEDRTGEPGVYRGQPVGKTATVEFGEQVIESVEAYFREKIEALLGPVDTGHSGPRTRVTCMTSRGGDEERQWVRLYGHELFPIIPKEPIAWLPLGILEEHGNHLPWGLDGLKAHGVCTRLAKAMGGLVMPAIHLAGIHGNYKGDDEAAWRERMRKFGDLLLSEELFKTWLVETFDSLGNMGFKVIVAYTGHYPGIQVRVLEEAAEEYNARGEAKVIPFAQLMATDGEGDHAGKYETSIFMNIDPDRVRLDAIRDAEGREGFYRGKEIKSSISKEFGVEALGIIEAWMREAVEKARG